MARVQTHSSSHPGEDFLRQFAQRDGIGPKPSPNGGQHAGGRSPHGLAAVAAVVGLGGAAAVGAGGVAAGVAAVALVA